MESGNRITFICVCVFLLGVFIFFAYWNFNWFPEKERKIFTIKLYYQNGREAIKSYELPASTKLWLTTHSDRSSLLSIWYHNDKPFGMEYGYLAMGVNDYKIIACRGK